MANHCSDCDLEYQNSCPRYGGKNECVHAKEAVKGMEYDMHSDSCFTVPECPDCGCPLFIEEDDIGKTVECGCGEMVKIPDADWTRKYVEDFTGEYTEECECLNEECNGVMKVYRRKYNGNWITAGGKCEKCGFRFIV